MKILIKQLLHGNLDENSQKRHIAALSAVREKYYSVTELTLQERLNDIIRSCSDNQLVSVFLFLKNIDDCWQYLKSDMKSKLIEFIKNTPKSALPIVIPIALDISELRDHATLEISKSSDTELLALIQKVQRPEYVERALELYCNSNSWSIANTRTGLITSLVTVLTDEHVERVMYARLTNSPYAPANRIVCYTLLYDRR